MVYTTHTFPIDKSTTSAQVLILHIDCGNQLISIFPFEITVEYKIQNMIIIKRREFPATPKGGKVQNLSCTNQNHNFKLTTTWCIRRCINNEMCKNTYITDTCLHSAYAVKLIQSRKCAFTRRKSDKIICVNSLESSEKVKISCCVKSMQNLPCQLRKHIFYGLRED